MQKFLRILALMAFFVVPWAANAQETLTIYEDGTETNSYVPVHGLWADAYLKCEFVVPAEELEEMSGGTVSQMDFYLSSTAAAAWTGTFQVFLMEVDDATISAYYGPDNATVVYEGQLDATSSPMSIVFTDSYTYGGGNLLVGVYQIVSGNYKSAYFYGQTVQGASIQGYNSSSLANVTVNQRNFIPKTTFTYEPAAAGGCAKPSAITVSGVTGHDATLSWTAVEGGILQYKKSASEDWGEEINYELVDGACTYTLHNLTPNTQYNVRVNAICGPGDWSDWREKTFTTDIACPAPTGVTFGNITTTSAMVSCTSSANLFNIQVNNDVIEGVALPYNITGLAPGTTYAVKVKALCGDEDGESEWSSSYNLTTAFGIPLNEPFNNSTIPVGWAMYTGLYSDGSATLAAASYGWSFGTGNGVFDSHARVNIYGNYQRWLVTPALVMEDNVQLTFDLALTVYTSSSSASPTAGNQVDDRFAVLVSTDGGTTWEILRVWDNAGSEYVYDEISNAATGEGVAIDLSDYAGQSVIIAFYGESTVSNGDNNLHIDNVSIDYIPDCAKPTGVTASNVTAHEATINWTSDATAWQICLDNDMTNLIDVTAKPYTVNGLTAETAHSVMVRANCGGTYSEWTNAVSFTTTIACTAPTSVATSNLTGHGVTVTWTAVEGATFEYGYGLTEGFSVANITWESTTANTVTLSDLDPETGYTFVVRKDCNEANDGYSQAVTKTFTTLVACPAPTGLAAVLTPGDGTVATLNWNAGGAENWVLEIATTSDFAGVTGIEVSGTPTKALSDLTPETMYYARVKAVCGGNDGESQWSNIISFTPTNAFNITVSDGTTTNGYVPVYGFYADAYLRSQIIYPADMLEDMVGGNINSITFYASQSSVSWGDASFQVNIVEVNDATFSTAEWNTEPSTTVYEGSLSIVDGKLVVELPTSYMYLGGNLLVEVLCTQKGSYATSSYYGTTVNGASLQGYNYNSLDNVTPTQRNFLPKTTFDYVPGEMPDCLRPTGLAVNYTGGTEATVTWNGEADAYNIDVNGTVTNNVTSPYVLSGLELATTYSVKVQADCGTALSDWTNPVNFTTDLCTANDMCEVSITLTDAYNDGGGQIQVVDVLTGDILGAYTNSGASTTYQLGVCNGRELNFVFASTDSWPYENGYLITDINEEVIAEHEGCASSSACDAPANGTIATYTVSCAVTNCKTPTNLAASEIGPHSAKLSWTENGESTSWVVAYRWGAEYTEVTVDENPFVLTGLDPETTYYAKVRPVCEDEAIKWSSEISFTTSVACPKPTNLAVEAELTSAVVSWTGFSDSYTVQYAENSGELGEGEWLQYDNGEFATSIGSSAGGNWTWGVMYPAEMQTESTNLTKVALYENSYYTDDVTINVYLGGEENPDMLVSTETVTPTGNGFHEVALSNPVPLSGEENLWITITMNGTYVLSSYAIEEEEPNSQWVYSGGSWQNIGILAESLAGYGWMIRGYMDPVDYSELDWITADGTSSPCTLTGLESETSYFVRVKADCGQDGESNWTMTSFTTAAACDVPVVYDATEITSNSATISWSNYQDNYNVRYREAAGYQPVWEDDFENGLDAWTITYKEGVAEQVGTNDAWYAFNPANSMEFVAHGGNNVASSWSWNSSAYQADNWLITPQLNLHGVAKFYVRTNAGYPDSYEIRLSTATNDTNDFTVTLQEMAPAPSNGEWNEVIISLAQFEGQQGYIGFHHVDYDMNYLLIDDFGIYNVVEADEWVEATTDDASLALTDLTPNTTYEWQVQGINASCDAGVTEWSELATFTTEEAVAEPEECELAWSEETAQAYVGFDFTAPVLTNPHQVEVVYGSVNEQVATVNEAGAVSVMQAGTTTIYAVHYGDEAYLYDSVTYTLTVANPATLTLAANGEEMGSVYVVTPLPAGVMVNPTAEGVYNVIPGTQVSIYADAAEGYDFVQWNGGNTSNPRTVTVNSNVTYTATFVEVSLPVSYMTNPEGVATISGPESIGYFTENATYSISNVDPCYTFVGWSDGIENEFGADETLVLSYEEIQGYEEGLTLVANFAINIHSLTVGVAEGQSERGSATIMVDGEPAEPETFECGSTINIVANANYGYSFEGWLVNGEASSDYTAASIDYEVDGDATILATFTVNQYTINGIPNNTTYGTVTRQPANGVADFGGIVTLTAEPLTGYNFLHWTDAQGTVVCTTAVYEAPVQGNATYTAVFELQTYTVTGQPNDQGFGTVTGGGEVAYGSSTTLTAQPNTGYRLVKWVNEAGDQLGTNTTLTIAPTGDMLVIALFDSIEYNVSVSVLPANVATVSGPVKVKHFSTGNVYTYDLNNECYEFTGWTVAANADYEETADGLVISNPTSNVQITANFTLQSYPVNASVAQGQADRGTVTLAQSSVNCGSTVEVTANANFGYTFEGWLINGEASPEYTEATINYPVYEQTSFVATFTVNQYTVTGVPNNTAYGSVSSVPANGMADYLGTVTLTATPAEGYHFVRWTNAAGNEVCTTAVYEAQVLGNATYTANFQINTYTVAAEVNDQAFGYVTGTGTVNYGGSATLVAHANTGYEFIGWFDNAGEPLSEESSYAVENVVSDVTVYAVFDTVVYNVTYSVTPAVAATISGPATVKHFSTGNVYTLSGVNECYTFSGWTVNNVAAEGTVEGLTVDNPTGNLTIKATFTLNRYNVTAAVAEGQDNRGSVSIKQNGNVISGANVACGTNVVLNATAATGCYFEKWTNAAGETVSTDAEMTVPVTASMSFTAHFLYFNYEVSVVYDEELATVTGAGTYYYNTPATLTVSQIADNYEVAGWYIDNEMVQEGGNSYTIESVTAPVSVSVLFQGVEVAINVTANGNTVSVTDMEGEPVTANSPVRYGDWINLSGEPAEHHHFVMWVINGEEYLEEEIFMQVESPVVNVEYVTEIDNHFVNFIDPEEVENGTLTIVTRTEDNNYPYGTVVTLTATAATGYTLTGWTDDPDNTESQRTYTVEEDIETLIAPVFTLNTYTVTVNYNADLGTVYEMTATNPNGTVVTPGTQYQIDHFASRTFNAVYASGNRFSRWSDGTNNYNTTTITYSPTSNVTLTAYFVEAGSALVSATTENPTWGHFEGTGEYNVDQTFTVTAVAETGYEFVSWAENNYNVTINGNAITGTVEEGVEEYDFVAVFAPVTVTPTVAVMENGEESENATVAFKDVTGTTTLTGSDLYYGRQVKPFATIAEHYHFENWTVNGETVNGQNPTITLGLQTSVVLNIAIDQHQLTVNAGANGTVNGSGTYDWGSTHEISATANEHYHFVQWNDGNTENPRNVVVNGDETYTATFAGDVVTPAVAVLEAGEASENASVVFKSGATVLEGNDLYYGRQVTLNAAIESHYHFVKWVIDDQELTTNAPAVTLTDLTSIELHIAIDQHTLAVATNNEAWGSVAGDGTYDWGSTHEISATATEGYHFVQWNDGNVQNPRTVTINGDVTYTATFAADGVTPTVTVMENGEVSQNAYVTFMDETGNILEEEDLYYGLEITLNATVLNHRHFVNWVINGQETGEAEPTVTLSGNTTVILNIAPDQHTLTIAGSANGNVIVEGAENGQAAYGSIVTLTAVPAEHYHFVQWNDGNTENPREVEVTGNITFTATFAPNTVAPVVTVTENGEESENATVAFRDVTGTELTGDDLYYGRNVTLNAVIAEHYHFVSWTVNGEVSETQVTSITLDEPTTVALNIAIDQHTLTVNAGANGTVAGSGVYDYGTDHEISATANEGYHFVQWNDGNVQNPRTVTVNGDVTYTASFAPDGIEPTVTVMENGQVSTFATVSYTNAAGATLSAEDLYFGLEVYLNADIQAHHHFMNWVVNGQATTETTPAVTLGSSTIIVLNIALDTHTVTLAVNNAAMGTVEGDGEYAYGTSVTVSATPANGYRFVDWKLAGETVSEDASYTFTIEEDVDLFATFTLDQVEVTITSDDPEHGTVTGGGIFTVGTTATIEAIPAEGWHFVQWSDGNTDNPRQVTVTGAITLTAEFAINTYNVTIAANDPEMGSIEGLENVEEFTYGLELTLTAVPAVGHHFTGWSDGVEDAERIVTITADMTLTANFAADLFDVDVTADSENGTVEIEGVENGQATYGSTITLTAVPAEGWHFVEWSDGNTENPRTIVVDGPINLTAIFAIDGYTLTLLYDEERGTATGAGSYTYGQEAVIEAVANEHLHFVRWNDDNTENPRTIVMTSDTTFTAFFNYNIYTVTVEVEGEGTVEGAGEYTYGTVAELTATPADGYSFAGWSDGDETNPRVVTVEGDVTYTAIFQTDQFSINIIFDDSEGNVDVEGEPTYGNTIVITATANEHFHFVGWNDGNTENPRTIVVEGDINLEAIFAPDVYTLTVTSNDATMGIVNGAGDYAYGSTATLTAIAAAHYHFVQWSDGNTDNPRVIALDADLELTAVFAADIHTVAVICDAQMGSVEGAGTYAYGTQATLTVTPAAGYVFAAWTVNGQSVSTEPTYTFTVEGDIVLTATFNAVQTIAVTVNYNDAEGTVTGAGIYSVGSTVTLTAIPADGYRFVRWSDGNTENPRIFTATANVSLTAIFEKIVGIDDVDMGSVTISSVDSKIVVRGAEGMSIYVFDVNGRVMNRVNNATDNTEFRMENTGVYLVKVGNAAAKRVVVVR